jgi:hypothetical protein
MALNWRDVPLLRADPLLFVDASAVPRAGSITPCLLCMKPMIMPAVFAGEPPDQLCDECRKTYRGLAKVACLKCKVTIGRCIPRTIDSGYTIQPNQVLHVKNCNVCSPGIPVSFVVEIDEWERKHRPGKLISTGAVTAEIMAKPHTVPWASVKNAIKPI